MGREQLQQLSEKNNTHRYRPYGKSKKEKKREEKKLEEDEDVYFFETWYIPKHMIMSILQYLDLKSLVLKGLLINRKFYKLIVDDSNGILWGVLCSKQASWLKPLFHDLKKSLKLRKNKWMRFLSIFADNYNEWDCEPNYNGTAGKDFKLFSNSSTTSETNSSSIESNTKQTVLYLGNQKNTSCSSIHPITNKTVKLFHIRLDQKPNPSNVGIGLAEKNFLLLERKFVGFNPFNVGCSSNGKARCFFPNSQERHKEEECPVFVPGDVISVMVDMLGARVSFYINGKLSHQFQNVDYKSFDPYRITVTMYSSGDQFSFLYDSIPFTTSALLEIYDTCERTFDLHCSTLYDIKNEFIELAEQFINICEDKLFILETKQKMKSFIDNKRKD